MFLFLGWVNAQAVCLPFSMTDDADSEQQTDVLVEIPQSQGKDISDGASRADMVVGEEYTTYTTKTDICVIVKIYNVNVKDCDYILFKFAEPTPSGIKAAFWKQGGTDNVDVPTGSTEYKYVFAEDSKCAVKDGVLPQLTLLTIYAGTAKTVKITGIYKHYPNGMPHEPDVLEVAMEKLQKTLQKAKSYTMGDQLGQYSGDDPSALIAEAEAYVKSDNCEEGKLNELDKKLTAALRTLSINLPDAGSEFRLYCPALKAYVSAPKGGSRMKMVSKADESTVFQYDGKNLIGKLSGRYAVTYDLNADEGPDQAIIIPAYGNLPGLYTIEFMGGEKERVMQAQNAGTDLNRHYLISQSGYSADTQPSTAFEIQLISGDVLHTRNVTDQFITNPSFETGDMTGWVYTALRGDADAKPNSDGVYHCNGADGDYLFNTWLSSDSRVSETQDHCAYQTLYDLPEGEYRVEVLAATNQKNGVTLFANHFKQDFVPRAKETLTEHRLLHVYVTPETKSLVVGVRSVSWFRCDNLKLTYLGQSKNYKDYLTQGYETASIMKPVILDCFDGQRTDGFAYTPEDGAKGTFPSTSGGLQNDATQVDKSKLQLWTSNASALGDGTVSTSWTGLPNGYYKVSSNVRVYDFYGSVNKPAKGLTFFAGESETNISNGSTPTSGDNKSKGFWGTYGVVTEVKDGSLTAGFRIQGATFNWLGWQNFTLEYLGTHNPSEEILELNLPEGEFVALCLPYDITPDYFGPIYCVADVNAEGVATILPNYSTSVAAGTPCVVKATGKNPDIAINGIQISGSAPKPVLTIWNNTLLQGSFDNLSWTADLADRTRIEGGKLKYVEADITDLNFKATQMNRAAQRFWAENPTYTTSTQSTITNYLNEPTYVRRDQPNPIIIPVVPVKKDQRLYYSTDPNFPTGNKKSIVVAANSDKAELYNLLPGYTYYYYIGTSKAQQGQFVVDGSLRMIYVGNNVYNVRDLGGKKTQDGRYVKYGKIFRSGELNGGYKATTEELSTMKAVGVGAEIDLRGEIDNSGAGTSAYGFKRGTTYYYVGGDHYIADEATKLANGDAESKKFWKEELLFTFENLKAGRGINFHCRIGADRTGCLGMLLEGLLGVTESDLIRDYETTSFSTAAGTRIKHNTFDTGLNYIKNLIPAGGNLRDGFDKYVVNTLGIKKALIEEYRELMLTDELVPTAIQDIITEPAPAATEAIYDLMGRRHDSLQPGINIVNGKKVLVK